MDYFHLIHWAIACTKEYTSISFISLRQGLFVETRLASNSQTPACLCYTHAELITCTTIIWSFSFPFIIPWASTRSWDCPVLILFDCGNLTSQKERIGSHKHLLLVSNSKSTLTLLRILLLIWGVCSFLKQKGKLTAFSLAILTYCCISEGTVLLVYSCLPFCFCVKQRLSWCNDSTVICKLFVVLSSVAQIKVNNLPDVGRAAPGQPYHLCYPFCFTLKDRRLKNEITRF